MDKICFDLDKEAEEVFGSFTNTQEAEVISLETTIEVKQPEVTTPEVNEEEGRPSYRQTAVQNYFTCPKKYKLYLTYNDFVEDKKAMRLGRIFETYVFGHKPEADLEEYKKETVGKITAPTLNQIARQAEKAKQIFTAGEPFAKLRVENPKFIATGELDWLGFGNYEGEEIEAIWDLKYTANINEFWNKKSRKEEFLQGVWYTWMLFLNTGKLLPFIYVIVESTFDDPLIKMIRVDVKESDFGWLLHQLNRITEDYFFEPNVGEACMGWKGFGKCSMLEFCQEGRDYISSTVEINFEELAF